VVKVPCKFSLFTQRGILETGQSEHSLNAVRMFLQETFRKHPDLFNAFWKIEKLLNFTLELLFIHR